MEPAPLEPGEPPEDRVDPLSLAAAAAAAPSPPPAGLTPLPPHLIALRAAVRAPVAALLTATALMTTVCLYMGELPPGGLLTSLGILGAQVVFFATWLGVLLVTVEAARHLRPSLRLPSLALASGVVLAVAVAAVVWVVAFVDGGRDEAVRRTLGLVDEALRDPKDVLLSALMGLLPFVCLGTALLDALPLLPLGRRWPLSAEVAAGVLGIEGSFLVLLTLEPVPEPGPMALLVAVVGVAAPLGLRLGGALEAWLRARWSRAADEG